jgi:hypothetical protein
MSDPILHERLPFAPWMDARTARLPGVLPIEGGDWLRIDEAYGAQMAERDRLIRAMPDTVHALTEPARAAAGELYDSCLADLSDRPEILVNPGTAIRPDGTVIDLDRSKPLLTLGRLVQEDMCILQRQGDEHVLTGAILCFPASWSLDEKLGRPLTGIHRTVKPYDEDIARRVQRLFDAMRPEQPLWRMNALVYADPTLHQPGREDRPRTDRRGGEYLRAERQCFVKLPRTGAVVFSIHTYVVRLADLTEEMRAGLEGARL